MTFAVATAAPSLQYCQTGPARSCSANHQHLATDWRSEDAASRLLKRPSSEDLRNGQKRQRRSSGEKATEGSFANDLSSAHHHHAAMAPQEKQPAVLIVARHGPRLDAADQQWHLSTPTPYDPPLTYGGWNQCRALGQRIASLLHSREQQINESTHEPAVPSEVRARDFGSAARGVQANGSHGGAGKKRKRKHKVVIHTSPFLRCLETSVAIAAGLAQYQPAIETASGGSRPTSSRTPNQLHSASPRLRAADGGHLPSINEPARDLAHEIAKRALGSYGHSHRMSKLRVDAFLGEWLNPQYFDQITPPPPSNMMVATAKGELIQNETIDVYTPSISSPRTQASNSLWGGSGSQTPSRESTLDDWSLMKDQMGDVNSASAQPGRRSRHNSFDSNGSTGSKASGRKSPFRSLSKEGLQPLTLTKSAIGAQSETEKEKEKEKDHQIHSMPYISPVPTYAVSSSDKIPKGYFAHARNACVDVDYQWDSSKPPQDWGDGGEYGEEWSSMHRRFRRGLNHLVHWYSQHSADDRGEDALGFDQAEKHDEDDEDEDLVVIMVTHGAGCNALIGAMTGQPVLLDVGMASLTMAVRKEDAPAIPATIISPTTNNYAYRRRGSVDMGLSDVYDMKFVASSEHLRPGANPNRVPYVSAGSQQSGLSHSVPGQQQRQHYSTGTAGGGDRIHAAAGASINSNWNVGEGTRTSHPALGSIRRPSSGSLGPADRSNSTPYPAAAGGITPPFSPGLWTPPGGRSPNLAGVQGQSHQDRRNILSALNEGLSSAGRGTPGKRAPMDGSKSPASGSLGPSSSGPIIVQPLSLGAPAKEVAASISSNGAGGIEETGEMSEEAMNRHRIPSVDEKEAPTSISRGLSQKGLWGARPQGDAIQRTPAKRGEGKRRWTVDQREQ